MAVIAEIRRPICKESHELLDQGVQSEIGDLGLFLAHLTIQPTLLDQINAGQEEDAELCKIKEDVRNGKSLEFRIGGDGTLRYGSRLCVPSVGELRREIMAAAHQSVYTLHPGSTKMYQDLKQCYW